MIGWLMLLLVALLAALLLWRSGFPRRLWTIPATALMLGAAGYAWQGSPGLAGKPAAAQAKAGPIDPGVVALRDAMFGRFTFDFAYFTAADAMSRSGSPRQAAEVMVGAVRKAPNNAPLWTMLGLKLAENDGGQISPASKFAFQRALQLAPQHPGPQFFYGLALVRENKFAEARLHWARAVELTPADASYRGELVLRLFLLDRFLEAQAAQEKAQAAPASRP